MNPEGGSALEDVAVHGVTWLAIACGVGLLMAVLLLVPETGRALGSLTYGRWAPVHLNATLYGWCGLPLLGLLLRLYRGPAAADGLSRASRPGVVGLAACRCSGVACGPDER